LTAHAVTKAATSNLFIAGSNKAGKNRVQSMDESQVKSPKLCFSADSYLVYGIRRDSRVPLSLSCRAQAGHPVLLGADGDYWIIRLRG
jgi:hypothetical protein